MNDLFALTNEYLTIYDLLTDPEVDPQTVTDTLEGLMGEIEIKAEGLVAVINRIDMEIEACKKHEAEWNARKKVRQNSRDRLTREIIAVMDALGVKEIKAGDVSFKTQNAGGQLPLVIDETKTVPERFTKLTIEADKALIRKALDDGEKLDFAQFGERAKVLKIK